MSVQTLLARDCPGNALVELFHTSRGYECRLSYMGQAKYTTVSPTEAEGWRRYGECCAAWEKAAELAG